MSSSFKQSNDKGTPQKTSWRVGVVGTGYVSHYHLSTLKKLSNTEIVGVADFARDRANEVAAQYGVKGVYTTLAEMIKAAQPDVIHVLTPPTSHCPLTVEALQAGCHVFVEKPMAASVEECDQMLAKAKSVNRVLSIDHSARFDPALLRGLEAVRAGKIGDILAVEYIRSSEYPSFAGGAIPEYYRDGGYPFRDLGVHALYVIEAFLGEIIEAEGAFHSTGRQVHLTFDEWQARATCQKGSAQIYLSWNSRPMQNTIIVHGTSGRLVIDSFLETCSLERSLPGGKIPSMVWNGTAGAVARAGSVVANVVRFAAGRIGRGPDIEGSIREFYAALSAGKPAPVSAEEGRRIVEWVEKIAKPADVSKPKLTPVSDNRPAQVLVTGAAGFLGRRLVTALLDQGKTVRALVRRPSRHLPNHRSLRIVYGDLGQPEVVDAAIQGVDTVYHVGATTGGDANQYEAGTISGTKNVVEAALRHQIRKVVYVSSLSVLDYTQLAEGTRVDESAPLERFPDNRGLYPKTKLVAEQIVLDGVARGLDAVLIRPGMIFGPGAEENATYGVFKIGKRWMVIGNGQMEAPLVYVDDVVDALIKAETASTAPGLVLHVVDEHTVTQRQYIASRSHLFPEDRATYVPRSIIYSAAVLADLLGKVLKRGMPLTPYRLRSLKGHLRFDCSKAKREIGWTPQIGVIEGLKRTFESKPNESEQHLAFGERMSA